MGRPNPQKTGRISGLGLICLSTRAPFGVKKKKKDEKKKKNKRRRRVYTQTINIRIRADPTESVSIGI